MTKAKYVYVVLEDSFDLMEGGDTWVTCFHRKRDAREYFESMARRLQEDYKGATGIVHEQGEGLYEVFEEGNWSQFHHSIVFREEILN